MERFREGRRLLQENRVEQACAELARSRALEPRTGTLLNLGDCQVRLGKLASAHATFLEARLRAIQVRDDRRAAEAERRAASVAPDIATLTLVVPYRLDGMRIVRDGERVEPERWGTAEPLDPGPHTIVVSAPGYETSSLSHVIEPSSHGTVVVETLERSLPALPVRSSPVLAVGVAIGSGVQRESLLVGVRVTRALVVPHGQLRAVGAASYSNYPDEPAVDPAFRTTTISLGFNVDYAWMPHPRFGLGGGLGLGIDYDRVNHRSADRQNDVGTFWAVRATPITVRLRDGTLELGLHAQAQLAGDELAINGIAVVDWFVW